jgi:hypothetical protein
MLHWRARIAANDRRARSNLAPARMQPILAGKIAGRFARIRFGDLGEYV